MCVVCGGIWKGDIFVADVEELQNLDASEIHARRLNAKEVLMPKKREEFRCTCADGTVKLAGRDQVFRTSTSTEDLLAQGEEHNDVFQGDTDGSHPSDQQADDIEA